MVQRLTVILKYAADPLLKPVEIAFVSEGAALTAAVLSVRVNPDIVDLGKPANFPF